MRIRLNPYLETFRFGFQTRHRRTRRWPRVLIRLPLSKEMMEEGEKLPGWRGRENGTVLDNGRGSHYRSATTTIAGEGTGSR
jgi:hypothetical protein